MKTLKNFIHWKINSKKLNPIMWIIKKVCLSITNDLLL